jgi:hypothetical protein
MIEVKTGMTLLGFMANPPWNSNGGSHFSPVTRGKRDETVGRPIFKVNQIMTEEDLTYENAMAMYNAAKQDILDKGFVHSFVQGCLRKEPNAYRLFGLEFATSWACTMNLRRMCVIAGSFLPSMCCLDSGVNAMGRPSGSIVATGPMTVARFDQADLQP